MPLHSGAAPRWLFERMVDLGGAIAEAVIAEYGREELLRRLADPYWFQALGCVLGFDWHASGVTTTTMGALKEALDPEKHGIVVAGGKGGRSRKTPDDIEAARIGLSGGTRTRLADHSRLSATVDDACVLDTYTLYHHTMVVSEDGDWCVIQQGMNDRTARRYHWLSGSVEDFVVEPQAAICDDITVGGVRDLTAGESGEARAIAVNLLQDDPSRLKRYAQSPEQSSLATVGAGTAEGIGPAAPAAAGRGLTSDGLGQPDQGPNGAGPAVRCICRTRTPSGSRI
ncbi:MAG: DUF763 domain-containing protein [Haloarculaceae archaeon]